MNPLTLAELQAQVVAHCMAAAQHQVTCYYCDRRSALDTLAHVVVVAIETASALATVGTVCRVCAKRRAAEIALANAEYDHWRLWGARIPERKVM